MTIQHAGLQCELDAIQFVSAHFLTLRFPIDNCCDMDGAIALAMSLLPDVAIIQTYAGDFPDTRYERVEDGKWEAYERRGFRPDRI